MRLRTSAPDAHVRGADSRVSSHHWAGIQHLGLALWLFLSGAVLAQTPPKQQRDIRFEAEPGKPVALETRIPRSYALVIGIARYQNLPAGAQLQYSERDAEDMYLTLLSREAGNFQHVRRLIGPQATLANIRRELEEWLPSVTADDDRVLVYFAGHGFVHNGRAYLAPYDIHRDNIPGTGYPMEQLGRVFSGRIRGKWKVLLTDACHSGAITPGSESETLNRSLAGINPSLFSLTASRDRELSYEGVTWGGGHGVFTYFVKTGLEGAADESGDGIVTADELAEYVRRNVREATRGAPGGPQTPTSDRGSFDANMLLSFVASRVKPADPPPPKEGTLVVEVNMDGVEVFLDGRSVGMADKAKPLVLPGLTPGVKLIKAVHRGYEPAGPREETVYPGQRTTVTLKLLIPARRNKAAVDFFDQGLEFYQKGLEANYRKAVERFEKALQIDARYSDAALYLGRAYNALYDEPSARKYLDLAIAIDPDYLEAHSALGGMLLDIDDVDEAVRHLALVTQRDPSNTHAWYLLAQGFRMKGQYAESIDAARRAVTPAAHPPEAHFWLAESLRMSGQYDPALREYSEYLRRSDFDTKLAGKINFYVRAYLIPGVKGRKSRPTLRDIWRDLRGLAWFGICNSEYKLNRFDAAVADCQKALVYQPNYPYAHYILGLSYARKAQEANDVASLPAARTHFARVLEINADLAESDFARQNITAIDAALRPN
ncbi:MAG: caspase family protein [Bryobacteraceae bacterium]